MGEALLETLGSLQSLLPALLVLLLTLALLHLARLFFRRHPVFTDHHTVLRSLLMIFIALGGAVGTILALPIRESTQSDLMTLLGIVASGAIALSSTTFVGNAMAGFLLRVVHNFRPGDYVRVDEHFGRVSEQGVFHTEIQTEESTLTTLPNLYLMTRPVTVIREGGTIISATVSLGYDVPHVVVERVLNRAAEDAGLSETYVQVLELGDFSITYRCAGMLADLKRLLSAPSHLRTRMLDQLHENGVEIVSPTFMNQRRLDPQKPVIPSPASSRTTNEQPVADGPNETIVFDKAERAGLLEDLRSRVQTLLDEGHEHEARLKTASTEEESLLQHKIDRNRVYRQYLESRLHAIENETRESEAEPR